MGSQWEIILSRTAVSSFSQDVSSCLAKFRVNVGEKTFMMGAKVFLNSHYLKCNQENARIDNN